MITMQKMPDANCFVYSCAMVMGVDAIAIFKHIGHRGTRDGRLVGVHYQEVLDYALYNGWIMALIERDCWVAASVTAAPERVYSFLFHRMVRQHDGVLIETKDNGIRHALAWSHDDCITFDPNGIQKRCDDWHIRYDTFIIFEKMRM